MTAQEDNAVAEALIRATLAGKADFGQSPRLPLRLALTFLT